MSSDRHTHDTRMFNWVIRSVVSVNNVDFIMPHLILPEFRDGISLHTIIHFDFIKYTRVTENV